MRDRTHFIRTFYYMEKEGPCLLFSFNNDGSQLRNETDIVHLFLCLHHYHEWFKEYYMEMLKKYHIPQNNVDSNHRVLLWTLYIMALGVEQDWTTLQSVLEVADSQIQRDIKLISVVSPGLYMFCQAMYELIKGQLYAYINNAGEGNNQHLVESRQNAFDNARKCMSKNFLSADWKRVRLYFSIHILLAKADATYNLGVKDLRHIQDAYVSCTEAAAFLTGATDLLAPK